MARVSWDSGSEVSISLRLGSSPSPSKSLLQGLSIVNVLQMGLVSVNVLAEPVTAAVGVVGSGPKVTVNAVSACAGLEQRAHVPHVTEGIRALDAEMKSQGPKWVSEDTTK